MRLALDIPFADTTAAQLRVLVRAGAVAPAGLATLRAQAGPFRLELRVLGASHAVVARADDRALTEIVACCTPGGVALGGGDRTVGGLQHTFLTEVRRGPVLDRARALLATAGDPSTLVASFPGSPEALTALRVLPAGDGAAAWETWHLYPTAGEGEAVLTRTRVELSA